MNLIFRYLFFIVIVFHTHLVSGQQEKWSIQKANTWYSNQPWMVGCNYLPQYAINQLEMWQAETFDTVTIDKELTWAENLGFNTLRVFLHELLWKQDQEGFKQRMDKFLDICHKHHIRVLFVFFDSCWDPNPRPGKQKEPLPGVHNSGWVQSPAAKTLGDPSSYNFLEQYVRDIIKTFATDNRIIGWDVWNEPDNLNPSSYNKIELPNKPVLVEQLLPQVFKWIRAENPTQPLTSGVWAGDWSSYEKLKPIEKIQIDKSDIISFHNYNQPEDFEKRVKWLMAFNRPLLCTEYMARGTNSLFKNILPICKHYKIAAYNWGFVAGKSNTNYPWDSWKKKYTGEPPLWFHDIYRPDGKPYAPNEETFIKSITGVVKTKSLSN